jgi:hypothetical protein
MIHTTESQTFVPKNSNSQRELSAGIHFESEGSIVDFDGADVKVIHGEGLDAGTVALQIGGACVWFSSLAGLIAELTGTVDTQRPKPVTVVS